MFNKTRLNIRKSKLDKNTTYNSVNQKDNVHKLHCNQVSSITGPCYNMDILISGYKVKGYLDTGSVISLLTENFVCKNLGRNRIRPLSELDNVGQLNFVTASDMI